MRQEISLHLNGQQVDLNDNGGIYFNYKQKDAKNPTVVKNSFSKTLTIPGTDNNDVIFNNIWDLTRVQTTDVVPYFNQSKRVPFELYLNGELIEQGYCKLDRIRRDRVNEYDLSLFGGLGDFFYSLAYDASNGVKKTLASLDYGEDLSFTINKETVKQNWNELASGETPTIAFAPMYNGIPDAIDAEKTLINTSGYTGMTRYDNGDGWYEMPGFMTSSNFGEYNTIDRYALAEGVELDEWQTRDLRSWCQRPVLHIPALFDAICNPDNNGGYEVFLDPEFFTYQNTYYSQAYITLPLINELDENKTEAVSAITGTINGSVGSSTEETNISLSLDGKWDRYSVNINLIAASNETNAPDLYTSLRVFGQGVGYIWGGFAMQLIGLDANRNQVAGSNILWLTSEVDGTYRTLNEMTNGISINSFKYSTDVTNSIGHFIKDGQFYYWSDTGLTLTLDTNVKIDTFRIKILPGNRFANNTGVRNNYLGRVWSGNTATQLTDGYMIGFNAILNGAEGTILSTTVSYSDIEVTQASLLNTEYTPADYLLSYCKLFNLYFDRDITKKKVSIMLSKNFYDKDVDLEDKIVEEDYDEAWKPYGYDRKMEIQPLSFEHKWYSFNYAAGNGPLVKNYKAKYGTDFGQQRVNTGYEFDSDTEELLTSNVFKNAVDYLPANKYFVQVRDENDVELPNFLLDNVTYHLYNDDGDPNDISVGISKKGSYSSINTKSTETIQYDSFNKVQFCDGNKPVDGANVLLFFNGMKSTIPDYWITDDLGYMFQLTDKATWLWTAIENDANGNQIAIKTNSLPQFSRYIMDDDYIYASWDFGRTKELYIPEISYVDGDATIYERYWRAYINDLYDIDTRIVTAYIQFDEKPTKESLKHFYYFEGSYWVIDEIIDYNPTSYELTKVKFVKVNDKNNYLNNNIVPPGPEPPTPIPSVSITSTSPIAYDATRIDWYVHKSYFADAITVTLSGNGTSQTTNITGLTGQVGVQSNFTIPANTGTSITYTLTVSLPEYPGYTDSTTVQQQAAPVPVTSITLSSAWATDVPATGGTATYQNCTNVVTAYYSDGTSADITSQASFTASTSLNVPSTTSTTRDSVGVISVIASYYDGPNPFTSTVVVTAYQEAAGTPPIPTVTWYITNNTSYDMQGNILKGDHEDYDGYRVLPEQTQEHTSEVPTTINEIWVGPSPVPPTSSTITFTNNRTYEQISCTYQQGASAWIGYGTMQIALGDVIQIDMTQSRGIVQEEPEPDETENEEEDSN